MELGPASGEDCWLSLARGGIGQVSHEMWGRWKSQNRKNVYLSPYVEKPLNSEVIKSFVPELRSRKRFSSFEIPMFYVYIYEHYERFAYRYEYVHFTYSYLAIVHCYYYHNGYDYTTCITNNSIKHQSFVCT